MSSQPLIDTHCHLNIVEKMGLTLADVLGGARATNVTKIVAIATELESAQYHSKLSETQNTSGPSLYWTAGLHPEAADSLQDLPELLKLIRAKRDDPYFMGIGETGLDYYHTKEFIPNQKASFKAHLELATELRLPVIMHLRDSQKFVPGETQTITDALELIRETGARGVVHCFTYSFEQAKPFIDLGWFISFSGIVTYKNADAIQDAAWRVPIDSMLVETDAPFLSPNPVRGQKNQPAHVRHTLDFILKLRAEKNGEHPDEVEKQIYENSIRFIEMKHA